MFALFYVLSDDGRFVDVSIVDETNVGGAREIGYVMFTAMQWSDFRRALGLNPNIRVVKNDRYAVTHFGHRAINTLAPYPGKNVMPPRQDVGSER